MSIGRAYDDIAHTITNGDYHDPLYARKVLDGAKESRDVELMHINERIFVKLRDFFEDISQ
ncbi:hypothetical protein EVA_11597 [gut metagenome]|uniref:Uncharacterized protein n=1 Tax=gut metagenome TaxID=749906 RepID=J9G0E2_9ZZZZ